MLSREELIRFIPKPRNEDVIIYDIELKDLIEVDVEKEYNDLLAIFLQKKDEYEYINQELKTYENIINNIYLFDRHWNREQYLLMLQSEKRRYSALFKELNKMENNINTLKNQIQTIDTKIEIQEQKDKKKIENKKEEIEKSIIDNKIKITDYKLKLETYRVLLEHLSEQIQQNEEEFKFLTEMDSEIKKGDYKCKYCGSIVKVHNENSLLYKRLFKNIETNKLSLEKLLNKKEEIETEKKYYLSEISKLKARLNNDIEFKRQNFNFYQKKSVEVLKLEGLKNELINNLTKLQKSFKTQPKVNTEEYRKIKDKINKYELSLANLQKIRSLSEENLQKAKDFTSLKKELKDMYEKLNHYKTFLTYFYKIYEQKASDFFGSDFKFKIFEFDDVVLNIIFEIRYKGIKFNELDYKTREELDNLFKEKIPKIL